MKYCSFYIQLVSIQWLARHKVVYFLIYSKVTDLFRRAKEIIDKFQSLPSHVSHVLFSMVAFVNVAYL